MDEIRRAVRCLPPTPCLCIAFSGGPDSSAFLEALVRLRNDAGVALPPLRAIHINHRLHPQSDAWGRHCEHYCNGRGVALTVLEVAVNRQPAESLEDAARNARYLALGSALGKDEILCTAQHANDQAETLLLQLLRGAGARGLAAMPVLRPFHSGYLARPLLNVRHEVLTDCVRQWNLQVVVDPANQEMRFARNRVRRLLNDHICTDFPGAVKTINRSAALLAGASQAIDTLSAQDIVQCRGMDAGTLAVAGLQKLSHARRLEVLRFWFREQGLEIPNHARLLEVDRQMITAGTDKLPALCWKGGEIHRYRSNLYAFKPDRTSAPPVKFSQYWDIDQTLNLPWGQLQSEIVVGQGLQQQGAGFEIRLRQGGERCRPVGRAHRRSLKRLLQEHRIAPWLRGSLPLIYSHGELAAVAGLWICEGHQASAGQPGRIIHWYPHSPGM